MSLEVGRQPAFEEGSGEHEVGFSCGLGQLIKIYSNLPILSLCLEDCKGKGFFKVAAISEAVKRVGVNGCHIPEVGDAGECEWE